MKKVFLSFFAVFAALVLLASCGGNTAKVTAISLDTSKAELVYGLGDEIDPSGIVVTLTYDNQKTQVISIGNCKLDYSQVDRNKEGTYKVGVSYTLGGVTVKAEFEVTYEVQMDCLTLNTEGTSTEFLVGSAFTHNGLQVNIHFNNGEQVEYTGTDYVVDSSKVNMEEEGTYEVVVTLVVDGKTLTGKYEVTVIGMQATISSVEEFLAMREFANEEGINERSYTLTCDIDLEGVELAPTKTTFKGVFDGAGHTIKNAKFTTTSSKQGMMFFLVEGATIKNVKFFACTIIGGASEATAFIAGECNAVGATFQNIEFSCCTVNNGAQNYAALLIGRNEKSAITLNFEGITVKNLTSVTSAKYAGILIGDTLSGSTINAKDCDIDFTVSCSSQFSVFAGRNRGANVNVENAVIRGEFGVLGNKSGVFSDGIAGTTIVAKNVIVLEWGTTKDSDMLYGNTKTVPSSHTYENVSYVAEDCLTTTSVAGVTAVAKADVDSEHILSSVLGNSAAWEADANKVVKLVVSSANTPSEGATVKELKLIIDAVDVQYFAGEALSIDGLLVTAIYSDGCVVALDTYEHVVKDSAGQVVEDFTTVAIGQYKVVVSSGAASAEYTVHVVKETGITINHEWAKKVYTVGQALDTANLVVFAEISDGTHTLLAASGYNVAIYNGAELVSDLKAAPAGTYRVEISRGDFAASYEIEVVEAVDAEELVVEVYVDAAAENGSVNAEGHLVFNKIGQALDYLTSLGLDELTKKEIYLAKGTYTEKLTITLTNVTLHGATDKYEETVIAYDSASDTLKPDESASYGTDGSAAVTIKSSATGFAAHNIYFVNTFDYTNSTLANKQALAVLCQADKAIFEACGFSGHQDTLEAKEGRQYYHNCYIEGSVDFIFGNNASVVFEGCQINARTRYKNGEPENNNGYVCATKGFSSSSGVDTVTYNYVFLNCEFTADEDVLGGSMSIARPWGVDSSVVTIGCNFSAAYATAGYDGSTKSRYFDMSGVSPVVARFYEYNNTGAVPTEEVAGMKFLTAEEAQLYTLENIFAQVNGQKDYGSAWDVKANPAESEFVSHIVKYESEQTSYSVGDTILPTTKEVKAISGNPLVGWTVENVEAVEKFYDAEGTEVANITAAAGVYVAKLYVGEEVVATLDFEVVAGNPTETKVYTFGLSDLDATIVTADKQVMVTPMELAEHMTATGTITYRWSDSKGITSIELGKGETGSVVFTVEGKATVVITASSTGGSNESPIAVKAASGDIVANNEGLSIVTGTSKTTLTYVLGTGTYSLVSPVDAERGRGFRLYSITISDEVEIEGGEVVSNLVPTHTITADLIATGEGLFDVAWGDFAKLSGSSSSKTWKVTTSTKSITDVNGASVSVTNRLQSAGSQRFLALDFTGYTGKVTLQLYVSAQGTSERTIAVVDALGTTITSNTTTASDMFVIEVTVDAGATYQVTTSNGYNFHAINFVGVE